MQTQVDILVHSLANGPEVTRPLLDTSRAGYVYFSVYLHLDAHITHDTYTQHTKYMAYRRRD